MFSPILSPLETKATLDPGLRRAVERNDMRKLLRQQEIREAAAARRAEFLNHRRFMRLYAIRHYLFRLAPRFAARVTL